jgi:hypothetical protein
MRFSYTLHVFYLDVAYGSNDFQVFFQVSWKHVSSVSTAFRRMLQLFYLDVSKVNRVLHLFSPSATSSRCVFLPMPARHPYDVVAGSFRIEAPCPSLSCRGGGAGPAWSAWNEVHRASVHQDVPAKPKCLGSRVLMSYGVSYGCVTSSVHMGV